MSAKLTDLLSGLWSAIRRIPRREFFCRAERQLRLCETLSLGSRGFLAVVRFEEQRFLVGGTNQSLALLADLSRSTAGPGATPQSPRPE